MADARPPDASPPQWVIISMTLVFVAGITLGAFLDNEYIESGWNAGRQVELSTAERSQDILRHHLEPMDIRLSIVDRATFDKWKNDTVGEVLAFTYVNQSPCRIVVPSDWAIIYDPQTADAIWDNSQARPVIETPGQVLAHEILHCQRGAWHR